MAARIIVEDRRAPRFYLILFCLTQCARTCLEIKYTVWWLHDWEKAKGEECSGTKTKFPLIFFTTTIQAFRPRAYVFWTLLRLNWTRSEKGNRRACKPAGRPPPVSSYHYISRSFREENAPTNQPTYQHVTDYWWTTMIYMDQQLILVYGWCMHWLLISIFFNLIINSP